MIETTQRPRIAARQSAMAPPRRLQRIRELALASAMLAQIDPQVPRRLLA